MKILHVSYLYSPSYGGNQIHNRELSEKMVRAGQDVTVFTTNAVDMKQVVYDDKDFDPLPEREVINGVKVQRFRPRYGVHSMIYNRLTQVRGGCFLKRTILGDTDEMWEHGPFIPGMMMEIMRLRPEVITVFNIYPTTFYLSYLASRWLKVPLVVLPIIHLSDSWKDAPLVRRVLNEAAAVVALTRTEKDTLVGMGIDQKKISVIGVGIYPEKVRGRDGKRLRESQGLGDRPLVSYVGRISESKGVTTLLRAMKKVWKEMPQARLLLAGGDAEEDQTELLAEMESLTPQERARLVELHHFRDQDKGAIYSAMDVFVMASNIDSFGITYLEAWANERPVIACRGTAQETLIDEGKDGLLTRFGDETDLARAIVTLLKDERKRKMMGQAGRKKIEEKYTWDKVQRDFMTIYRKVTAKGEKVHV